MIFIIDLLSIIKKMYKIFTILFLLASLLIGVSLCTHTPDHVPDQERDAMAIFQEMVLQRMVLGVKLFEITPMNYTNVEYFIKRIDERSNGKISCTGNTTLITCNVE